MSASGKVDKVVKYTDYIVIGILLIPVLLKLVISGHLWGLDSKRNMMDPVADKPARMKLMLQFLGHFLIGLTGGLLISPMHISSNKNFLHVRSSLGLLIVAGYPVYNYIKRQKKHRDTFFESSFYDNISHVVLSLIIGYLFGALYYKNVQKGKYPKYEPELGYKITMVSVFVIWLGFVLYSTFRTVGNKPSM